MRVSTTNIEDKTVKHIHHTTVIYYQPNGNRIKSPLWLYASKLHTAVRLQSTAYSMYSSRRKLTENLSRFFFVCSFVKWKPLYLVRSKRVWIVWTCNCVRNKIRIYYKVFLNSVWYCRFLLFFTLRRVFAIFMHYTHMR